MSTPSSVASGMSYRRKGHGRSKRGKSKIVATYDMYQRVLETEGMYHIDDERTLGLRPGQGQGSGENESALMMKAGDDVDDLRPEDAADAVSPISKLLICEFAYRCLTNQLVVIHFKIE